MKQKTDYTKKRTSLTIALSLVFMLTCLANAYAWNTPPPAPVQLYGFLKNTDNIPMENKKIEFYAGRQYIGEATSQRYGFFEISFNWDDPDTTTDEGLSPNGDIISFKVKNYDVKSPDKISLNINNAGEPLNITIIIKPHKQPKPASSHGGGGGGSGIYTLPEKNLANRKNSSTLNNTNLTNTQPSHNITLEDFINMSTEGIIKNIDKLANDIPVFPLPTNKSIDKKLKEYEIVNLNYSRPVIEEPKVFLFNYTPVIIGIYLLLIIILIIIYYTHKKSNHKS